MSSKKHNDKDELEKKEAEKEEAEKEEAEKEDSKVTSKDVADDEKFNIEKEIIEKEVSEAEKEEKTSKDDKSEKKKEKHLKDALSEKIGYLQRKLMEHKVPVIIVIEGAYASGKGRISNEILMSLDARYTKFYATKNPSEDELRKPFLDQFYSNIPSNNNFTIFYRSWYSSYIYYKNNKVQKDIYKKDELVEEILDFEKTLSDNGYVILKYKLSIDKKKQAEHIKKMLDNPLTTWKAQEYDKANNESYVKEMHKLMDITNTEYAPWNRVEYISRTETSIKIFELIVESLEKKLEEVESKKELTPMEKDGSFTGDTSGPITDDKEVKEMSKSSYEKKLKVLQDRMREVQYALYTEKIPMVLVFEGWDAAGKGGGIKRIIANLDPTNYTVNTTAAPTSTELSHHYLWRFANKMPKSGHISIWDRSWYGRVLVERIEGFASNDEWSRAYEEINNFEKIITDFNGIVIKFFLNISMQTQLERFTARAENPKKSWKITEEDWRNRDKWDKYTEAINDMIEKTSTKKAPWIIIDSNYKMNSRIEILENIIKICDKKLKLIDYNGK